MKEVPPAEYIGPGTRCALGATIGRVLPTSLVFDHPTADTLCSHLAIELGLATPSVPVVATPIQVVAPPMPEPAATDDLADDDALALLERKLSHAGY